MNAHAPTTFIRSTSMAPSHLLTRMDVSDVENVKDAQAELRRAASDPAKLAVWAAKWGDALLDRCTEAEGAITDGEVVTELEGDLRSAEDRSKDLVAAIRDGAKAIDDFLAREADDLASKHFEQISKIGDDLEAAI